MKGKAGKKTPEPPSAKNESKLRKRGEEDTDKRFIGRTILLGNQFCSKQNIMLYFYVLYLGESLFHYSVVNDHVFPQFGKDI